MIQTDDFKYRSVRRADAVKKPTQEHVPINGDVGGFTSARREPDFDIKLLQQKKQQAEIRRYLSLFADYI